MANAEEGIYFPINPSFGRRFLAKYENVERFQGGDNLSTEDKNRTIAHKRFPLDDTLLMLGIIASVGNTATGQPKPYWSC